ncbi:MAG: hypothetical protein EBU90_18425 [Proteobacteria bacterium]|nr:hypothetical protein [Pseudomonadota bacterium]NBP13048.1 hypothetical protein [bacterium]
MANDIKLLAEAYSKIKEQFYPKTVDVETQQIQQRLKNLDDQIAIYQSGKTGHRFPEQVVANLQKQKEPFLTRLTTINPQAAETYTKASTPAAATATASTATQAPAGKGSLPGTIPTEVGGTTTPTAAASTATQQQDASALLKATTPRAPEFGEPSDGPAQPGTFAPTAAPQVPSIAAAQSLPGAKPEATAPQAAAKASNATQQTKPSTARYIPQARMGWGRHPSGRKPDWASK